MTEEESDSFFLNRPFRREDFTRAEADVGRFTMLGLALWGRTPADLERQLDAPRPEIPPGRALADLLRLQRYLQNLQRLSAAARKPQNAWLHPLTLSSLGMLAGSRGFTGLEARLEVVRRAIDALENE